MTHMIVRTRQKDKQLILHYIINLSLGSLPPMILFESVSISESFTRTLEDTDNKILRALRPISCCRLMQLRRS